MSKSSKTIRRPDSPPELTVTEAARNFADVVNRVRYRGERFLLTKGGLPVAELRPSEAHRTVTGRALARRLSSLPHLGAAASERFATDLDEARRRVGAPGPGPWE